MPDEVTDATDETTEEETEVVDETTDETEEDDAPLGEAGKRALAAERASARAAQKDARAAQKDARAAKAELAQLKAQLAAKDKPADEQELDRVRREAEEKATHTANARILRSEIRAVATGKLADPSDAALYLDLEEFEVGDNGDVDTSAIEDAISELLTRKPHLAAGREKRFGNVNQSPKAPAKPGQLSQSEYNALSREDRRAAREAGRVKNLMGIN